MNKIKRNYVYNLTYQIFLLVIPIVVTPYLSRVLGSDCTGQYSFTFSIVTYFTLFASLGFSYYAQRLVASHFGDRKQQSLDFWEILIARFFSTFICSLLYIVLLFANVYEEKYQLLMKIQLINVVFIGIDVTFFFQGNEEFLKIVIRNILVRIVAIVLIFILVKSKESLWIYTLIQSLTVAVSYVSLWVYVPKYLCKISISDLRPFKHFKSTIILFIPTIAISIYTSLDKTLIGFITKDDNEVGFYEYSERLVKMAMVVLTSLGTVMIPKNSKLFSDGREDLIIDNIYKSSKFVWFVGVPFVFGIICIANNLIPWYLGGEYTKSIVLMQILSVIILLIGFSSMLGQQYLIPTKQDGKFTLCVTLGAVINFILNLILINFYGSIGAAISTVIAEFLVALLMFIFVRNKISFLKILKSSWKYFLSGLIMFLITGYISTLLQSSIINSIIIVATGSIIYFTVLVILKETFMIIGIKKAFKFIKKIFKGGS